MTSVQEEYPQVASKSTPKRAKKKDYGSSRAQAKVPLAPISVNPRTVVQSHGVIHWPWNRQGKPYGVLVVCSRAA